jgi:cysteine-rich repeat protein
MWRRLALGAAVAVLVIGAASAMDAQNHDVQILDDELPQPQYSEIIVNDKDVVTDDGDLGEGESVTQTPAATLLKAEVAQESITAIDETAAATGTCGDQKREGNEECDDGNTVPNDGCSATCKVEGGFQCLPLEVNGKDLCVACADNQCTTSFSLQSRCMETGAAMGLDNMPDMATEPVGKTSSEDESGGEPPVDAVANMKLVFANFLQEKTGTTGAYKRGPNGFCECDPNYCKLPTGTDSFVCKSTAKGWARKSLTDEECACAPGFCSMPIAEAVPAQFHCTPLHENMISNNNTGLCECRAAVTAVASSDPSLAVKAKVAACKILPVKPVELVPGGKDKFGEFECVGEPYIKAAGTDMCESCSNEVASCKMARAIGSGQFLCFAVTNGSSTTATAPYSKKGDGTCECGADQCLMPNGDHEVCRDLANAFPYGPMKHSDGKCGCSADPHVCKLAITGGFRCVHSTEDNFARNYRRAPNGDCECKSSMCIASPHKDNGALQCEDSSSDSPYQRTTGTFQCECKPGACKFPNGVCKQCPVQPGHCETMCHESTATDIQCVKFCRTKSIQKKMVRATAQGQLQSVKKTVAREIGCFVQKVTTCSITNNAQSCTQIKSAKALYDCPAAKSGSEPMRLRDGTETYGYTSMCDRKDLECQIQNCGRIPDSNLCQQSLLLV